MVNEGQSFDNTLRVLASWVHLINAVNIERRNVNCLRVKFARLYDFLNFCDDTVSRSGHISIEIACSFMELKIAHGICSFCFYKGKICE